MHEGAQRIRQEIFCLVNVRLAVNKSIAFALLLQVPVAIRGFVLADLAARPFCMSHVLIVSEARGPPASAELSQRKESKPPKDAESCWRAVASTAQLTS